MIPSPSVATEFVTLGSRSSYFLDEGAGDVLLLVHGHPFDSSMWLPQIEAFATSLRVVVPDLRGYGRSPGDGGIVTLTDFADDLAALLDHLDVQRAVMCGLSMGGQIVMEFLRLFPERVRALVLADTTADAETPASAQARRNMADRLEREGMGPYAREVLPKMVNPPNIESMPAVAQHVLAMMESAPASGAAAAQRGRAERPDYEAVLAGARVPALVVVGEADEFTPIAVARKMADVMPAARLSVLANCAHLPNLESPAEFNRELQAFLDSLVSSSADAAVRAATPHRGGGVRP